VIVAALEGGDRMPSSDANGKSDGREEGRDAVSTVIAGGTRFHLLQYIK
jgi:hypothetical protein